ncbi:MAG: outer membrane lipoprotein-sorting protein [Myxococcota bacterium]|jgi:outer membrane lipoprotein-sorting protein
MGHLIRNLIRVSSLAALMLPLVSSAVTPDETDPNKIMAAVDARPDGDKSTARLVMVVKDSAGRERKRVVQSRSIEFSGGTKQLMLFEQPADVRNTGLLSIDYDDGNKDDDQWLYLPSLRKSTRISSSDKSGSFMGTDLSYSDMTRQDPSSYTYKLLEQSKTVGGDDCWVIEARPKTAKAKDETGYVKSMIWVSKSKLLPVRAKNWVREGKKIKYIKFSKIKQVEGIWIAHKITAQTKRGKEVESTTVMSFQEYKLNQAGVTDADFNQRRLEKGL